MTTPEFHRVPLGPVTLHVAASGPVDGPLLILLHGFPEYWRAWEAQLAHFAAAGYRVLAPDQRGYNLSDKPAELSAYGLEALSGDVLALADWAGRRRFHLAGHDWGAAVAWWTALRAPERVKNLAVLNTPHPAALRRRLLTDPAQMRRSWYMLAFQLPWLPERLAAKDDFAALRRGLATSRRGTFGEEQLRAYAEAWSRPGALTGMINWYRAALRHAPPAPADPRVKPPTLIVWGDRDPFLRKELADDSLALCEKGRLERIPTATHWVAHEETARVNALLGAFLRS